MDRIILVDEKGRKRLLTFKERVEKIPGLGVVDFSKFPSNPEGKEVEIAGKKFLCLRPSVLDLVQTIEREAQIITAKDSASIILNCDVRSGDSVLEVGTGSAAMTIVLAYFVAPNGRVVSYDKREDFARLAGKNIQRAGLSNLVEIRVQDAVDGIEERDIDSAVVDIPNPWDVLDHIYQSLKPGGHLAVYVPTVNQMEKVVKEMKRGRFFDVRSVEIIQREMEVGELGTRPSYETLGHTGYLTYARKVVEK
ncbi:MAG: tRNA (adenine-N1)-methyltransferase [Methanomassiliicoccales archaeon]|nr:MAG: tRNA (adenine-N1)-methyltransferase [Methanomassiliicoccales archaeon]